MPLETGTFVTDLVPTNPLNSDPKSQGAAHLRLIKSILGETFPQLSGAVTRSQGELNRAGAVAISGTRVLFQQGTPPPGWVKVTEDVDNRALRVVSGTVGSGGNTGFSTIFASRSTSSVSLGTSTNGSHNHGGTNNHTLSVSRMPAHDHAQNVGGSNNFNRFAPESAAGQWTDNTTTGSTGGGNAHSHGISNDGAHSHTIGSHNHNLNMDVLYIDCIVARAASG